MRFYASSGGGVRIGATFGAQLEGERQGKFLPETFDYFVGTSAGALDAAMTANGWSAKRKAELFLGTNFARFFQPTLGPIPLLPFAARKAAAIIAPIKLGKLADFIDSLGLKPHPSLIFNTVDADENQQVIYCYERPSWARDDERTRWEIVRGSLGQALVRSMVLPGLVADHPKYLDGGFAENPLLSVFPDTSTGLLISLGYQGQVEFHGQPYPTSIYDRLLYGYEFKANEYTQHLAGHLPRLKTILPKVYDVNSADFGLSRKEKQAMLDAGARNTRPQWSLL